MIELERWALNFSRIRNKQLIQVPNEIVLQTLEAKCFIDGAETMRDKAVVLALQFKNCPPLLLKQLADLGEVEFDSKAI